MKDCPICGPVLEQIECAREFGTLSLIETRTIPSLKGISDEQRAALLAAIATREDELLRNANVH